MKHKDLIIAYANGKTIECRHAGKPDSKPWVNLKFFTSQVLRAFLCVEPLVGDEEWEFRIKPEVQS